MTHQSLTYKLCVCETRSIVATTFNQVTSLWPRHTSLKAFSVCWQYKKGIEISHNPFTDTETMQMQAAGVTYMADYLFRSFTGVNPIGFMHAIPSVIGVAMRLYKLSFSSNSYVSLISPLYANFPPPSSPSLKCF